jgi:hypothetical protein
MEIATHRRLLAPILPTSRLETRTRRPLHSLAAATALPTPLPPITYHCPACLATSTAAASTAPWTSAYPIVDP